MVNAQEWLDRKYPITERNTITVLDISKKNLTGSLTISDWPKLAEFSCSNNNLASLIIANCPNLTGLYCQHNQLTDEKLLINSRLDCLASLNIHNNNLTQEISNLSSLFSQFRNLKELSLSGNSLTGSLASLQSLRRLEILDIGGTKLANDIELLPKRLKTLYFYRDKLDLYKELKDYCEHNPYGAYKCDYQTWRKDYERLKEVGFTNKETKKWIELGFRPKDIQLIIHLKESGRDHINFIDELKEYQTLLEKTIPEKLTLANYSQLLQRWKKNNQDKIETIELKKKIAELEEAKNSNAESSNSSPTSFLITNNKKPTFDKLIGQGGFANVYQGTWNNQKVAIKKSKHSVDSISETEIQSIENEINLLKELRNRYIIQYYSLFKDEQDLMIIMELAESGSLDKYIKNNQNQPHNWEQNCNFIKNIANGLIYLHNHNVIHRDLKSLNILITEGMIAKISDFGLSKIISELNSLRSSSKGMAGTPRWLAPELITKRGAKHSFESDIYSLGMVIWEIVAQETVPFKDLEEDREVYGAFYRGERETIPQDTPEKITEIINSCWQENPQERIGLENILTKLEENNRNDSYQSQIEVINISNNTWN